MSEVGSQKSKFHFLSNNKIMKNCKPFLFAIVVLLVSCKSEHIKIKDKVKGSWQLANFEYTDTQNTVVASKKNYTMTFNDTNGLLSLNNTSYNFTYDFGYEKYDTGYANCNIDVENERLLPIEGIGKVQVYSYKFVNKNTIVFQIDKEYDFVNKQLMRNVTYTFVKI